MRRRPIFTAVALITLALGIGGTGTAFTLLQRVLLQPLPFATAERVVRLALLESDGPANVGPGYVAAWRETDGVASVAALAPVPAALTGIDVPLRLQGARTTASTFSTLGIQPVLGRTFTESEDAFGGAPVVLLSHRLWSSYFDEDPGVLGETISLSGQARTVIGVLPPALDELAPGDADATEGLAGVLAADFFEPLQLEPGQWSNFGGGWLTVLALLETGVEPFAATEALERAASDAGARDAQGRPVEVIAQPLTEAFTDVARRPLWILMGVSGAVLLLALLNVANLMLAQGSTRTREMAIRASLGAGGARLVRQLVTESVMLGVLGGTIGFGVAWLGAGAAGALTLAGIPRLASGSAGAATLVFCLGVAVVTGFALGTLPALRSGRADLGRVLRDGGGAGSAVGHRRTRWGLVYAQVTLAVVLLTGAGLMLRTAAKLASEVRGFDADVVTAQVTLPWALYPTEGEAIAELDAIVAATEREAGIEAVAYSSRVPLAGNSFGAEIAEASSSFGVGRNVQAALRIASPGYFEAMGLRLSSGRGFDATDDADGARAVVVNEALVRALELEDPVGLRLKANVRDFQTAAGEPILYEIVGVLADVRDAGVRSDAVPEAFFTPRGIPGAPWNWIGREVVIAARSSASPSTVPGLLRGVVSDVAPTLPLYDIRSMGERDARALSLERVATALLVTLACLALVLTVAGIYGVVSYLVARRTREIGLRIALGSSKIAVRGLVLRQTMSPVVAGVVTGVIVALSLSWTLDGLLYRVSPFDPITLLAVITTVGLAAAAATYHPARQASRVDPIRALTAE